MGSFIDHTGKLPPHCSNEELRKYRYLVIWKLIYK